jgi:drug/metabolite transporter (DMT)-like permease
MVFGMIGFAALDALLKALAGTIPVGQILIFQGVGGALIFALMGLRAGLTDWTRRFRHPVVLARNVCEVLAATGFVAALASASLSTIAAIIQSNPLLVTLGAALWLREPVGPWRWGAIFVGMGGVLLVIRPGMEGFEPAALLALGAVVFLSARDLLTRWVPSDIPTVQLGSFALISLAIAGFAIQIATAAPVERPEMWQLLCLLGTVAMLPVGIYGTTAAMRVGEMSVITPFRYSRLIFAMILAAIFFGERPDALTYLGAAIIVAAGIFTLWRERRAKGN